MAQTHIGGMKVAAKAAGVTVRTYRVRRANGQKHCMLGSHWCAETEFGKDTSRWDSLTPSCRQCRNADARRRYTKKARPSKGRSFVPARDGDKRQARRRINYFVEVGLLPHPNNLPCTDCAHVWRPGERRHEYDHYLGYAAVHHEHVQVTCSRCHRRRAIERGEWRRRR